MLEPHELTPPERNVWDAISTGEVVSLVAEGSECDSAGGANWGPERSIRGQLLSELLAAGKNPQAPPASFLRLRGARITGGLDLEGVTVRCPVTLQDCYFDEDEEVTLREAHVISLRLHGCHLPGLTAEQIETRSNLELSLGFTATREVNLHSAHIGGRLDFRGAVLRNADGRALTADGLTVEQDLCCSTGFQATGEVRLPDAHVKGQLDFSSAVLHNPGGRALVGSGLTVIQNMSCDGAFQADGEVSLIGAHISGTLSFKGAVLRNRGGHALVAGRLTVDGDMLCEGAFWADGEVSLIGSHINGMMDFRGARLYNPKGLALAADGLTVAQIMLCEQGFRAYGEVRLVGARIRGALSFKGATLRNPGGLALNANRLVADHYMLCRQLQANGEICLLGANIGGLLDFRGAKLYNPGGLALNANRLTVNEDLHYEDGFHTEGVVHLGDARLGGLYDSKETWPAQLVLDGLTYSRVVDVARESRTKPRPKQRLGWLRRSPAGYTPQPYEQLAAVYRRAGQPEAARAVLIAKQWDRRSTLHPLGKPLNWLAYLTVGYGYRTGLAGLWLAVLGGVGPQVFDYAHQVGLLTPAKDKAQQPPFHAVGYAWDVLLPIINLGQESAWVPHGWAVRWTYGFILAGWALTTAVVAGLTGVLKRD